MQSSKILCEAVNFCLFGRFPALTKFFRKWCKQNGEKFDENKQLYFVKLFVVYSQFCKLVKAILLSK
jgi:hypothetical protein